nr:MAG TPA: hypothetical protein [Caudoviricetes sp.]
MVEKPTVESGLFPSNVIFYFDLKKFNLLDFTYLFLR